MGKHTQLKPTRRSGIPESFTMSGNQQRETLQQLNNNTTKLINRHYVYWKRNGRKRLEFGRLSLSPWLTSKIKSNLIFFNRDSPLLTIEEDSEDENCRDNEEEEEAGIITEMKVTTRREQVARQHNNNQPLTRTSPLGLLTWWKEGTAA